MQGGLASLIIVLLMLGAAQGTDGSFRQLTVEYFWIKDKDGKVRIAMGSQPGSTTEQDFLGKDGKGRITIETQLDGTTVLSFTDKDGKTQMTLPQ